MEEFWAQIAKCALGANKSICHCLNAIFGISFITNTDKLSHTFYRNTTTDTDANEIFPEVKLEKAALERNQRCLLAYL